MYAVDIDWDLEDEGLDENMVDLPDRVKIPDWIQESEDFEEEVSDWLTEEYGFCHKGFRLAYT